MATHTPNEVHGAAVGLPIPPDAFIGRERELASLRGALSAGERLLTLVGVAGVGKTRLALELLRAWSRDGGAHAPVVFADLTEARDDDALTHAVAAAAGLGPAAAGSSARLAEALAGQGALVLCVDNVEHLVAAAARACEAWLRAAPALQVVVTSRERLRAPGEYAFEVQPLDVPGEHAAGVTDPSAALELLIDRARRTGRAPTPDEMPALLRIARDLEGVPLALELAAARLNAVGPAALAARLRTRLELLAHGPRGRAPRQASLRGSLDCSWELLEPWARAALGQCALFAGGFTLEAAEGVLELGAGAPSTLDALQALRDKSLLRATPARGGELRYAYFATVREYALEKLGEAHGASAAADRHARYFSHAAERWASAHGRGEASAGFIDDEHANLLAAAEYALSRCAAGSPGAAVDAAEILVALDPTVAEGVPLARLGALLDASIDALERSDAPARARIAARIARATTRRLLGDIDGAERDVRDTAGPVLAMGDPLLVGRHAAAATPACALRGRLREALEATERARAAFEAAGYAASEGLMLGWRAIALQELGDADDARDAYDRALAVLDSLANEAHACRVRVHFALLCVELGRHEDAERAFARALATRSTPWAEAMATVGRASGHHDRGEIADAERGYARGIEQLRRIGALHVEAMVRGYLGLARAEQGGLADADEILASAADGLEAMGDGRRAALFAAFRAPVVLARGDADAARALGDRARAQWTHDDAVGTVIDAQRAACDLAAAAAARALGDAARAEALASSAARALGSLRRPLGPGKRSPREAWIDARLALRNVSRWWDADAWRERATRAVVPAPEDAGALVIERGGRWFRAPSGPRVAMDRRRALRRLLVALAEARLRAPGRALGAMDLIALGWPGERIMEDAARNRLHVSLSALRALGLRDALRCAGDGWCIDPALPLTFRDASE